MARQEVTVAADAGNTHGEGPVWSDSEQKLYWTDIETSTLWQLDPSSGRTRTWKMPEKVCSFAFRAQGGLLIAFESGLSFYDLETGAERRICNVESDLPTTRLNDGRCDRQGRFIVGGFDSSGQNRSGAYRLDHDLSLHELFRGLSSANSTCFSLDGRVMYYANTPESVIWAFDYDIQSGTPAHRRVFCDFHDQPGTPDGSVIDAEGYLWNAQWNGARVVRYRPDGTIERIIEMPFPNPTSLAFGGPDLDKLYITSSRLTLSGDQLRKWPLSGALFSFNPEIRGLPENQFLG